MPSSTWYPMGAMSGGQRWGLATLLRATVTAMMAGAKSLADAERVTATLPQAARRWLGIARRVPDTTLRNALTRLQPDDLSRCLRSVIVAAHRRKALAPSVGLPFGTVALDGKVFDIYLIGISNGGGMVLKAAKERPDMFKGIAPFIPFDGFDPTPVPDLSGTGLERVIFGYAPSDPGLPVGYDEVLSALPLEWARALRLPEDVIQNPAVTELPDLVSEGEDYEGDNARALGTMDSTVTQLDMSAPDAAGRLRVLRFDRSGHLWPNPIQDTELEFIETYGFRNQDLDASDAIWSFFGER